MLLGPGYTQYNDRHPKNHDVEYVNAPTEWLFDYVRYAEDKLVRSFAAAGIMRALLNVSAEERQRDLYLGAVDWARDTILAVLQDEEPAFPDNSRVEDYVGSLPYVHATLDSISVLATLSNDPRKMADVINETTRSDEAKLIIGLGHGGILSSLATFAALPENSVYHPLRFSRDKLKDEQPVAADFEIDKLRELAADRKVVIHDEDISTQLTIKHAMTHIGGWLEQDVYGTAPVSGNFDVTKMYPLVLWKSHASDKSTKLT